MRCFSIVDLLFGAGVVLLFALALAWHFSSAVDVRMRAGVEFAKAMQ